MTSTSVTARKLFAPEVIQSSAMDCGPASLKSLLHGFGIPVAYGHLREACSTDVDGTSINTLEEVAVELGLDAEQVMLPVDHLLLAESEALPAIVVVQLANKGAHFVLVWRTHGRWIQVMDPAVGRRWMSRAALLRDVYRHETTASAEAWREYAASVAFQNPLRRRMRELGVSSSAERTFLERALEDASWKSLGNLDAAVRLADRLVASGAVHRGEESEQLLTRLTKVTSDESRARAIPDRFWSVRPALPSAEGEAQVLVRGALLVHGVGRRSSAGDRSTALRAQLDPELLRALKAPPKSIWKPLREIVRNAGGPLLAVAVFSTAVAAMTVLLQALLLRSIVDLGYWLGIAQHRLGAALALGVFLLAALLLDLPLTMSLQRFGRRLEVLLRVALARKIPRTADQYFHSRALSDLAERAHSLFILRELPMLLGTWLRSAFLLAFTSIGILWLAPWLSAWVAASVGVAVVLSVLSLWLLQEREMRARSHGGVLIRFYLDALLGISSIRAHNAGTSLLREQEGALVQWTNAHRRLQLAGVVIEALQAVAGVALAVGLVMTHVARQGSSGSILLVSYWALQLPVLAQSLAVSARQVPAIRNVLTRVLEPLDAPNETSEADSASAERAPIIPSEQDPPMSGPVSFAPMPMVKVASACEGVSVEMRGVAVRAGGRAVLDDVQLALAPGDQIAVVGASGAGKSTLLGLLLGWSRAAEGEISIDGKPLTSKALARWRRHTAWVDPAVHLFNRRFAENLLYGSEGGVTELSVAVDQADLREVLERLPEGMQTMMGEGGALVSGGEGQRVRIGRAWLRRDVRLVLLDEPFRGLARDRRAELLERARRHWAGATMICVTHDVSSTLTFGRVLVVEGGRIVEDGDPRALAADASSRYHALLTTEKMVQGSLWGSFHWRRFKVENGLVEEQPVRDVTDMTAEAASLSAFVAKRALGPAND